MISHVKIKVNGQRDKGIDYPLDNMDSLRRLRKGYWNPYAEHVISGLKRINSSFDDAAGLERAVKTLEECPAVFDPIYNYLRGSDRFYDDFRRLDLGSRQRFAGLMFDLRQDAMKEGFNTWLCERYPFLMETEGDRAVYQEAR